MKPTSVKCYFWLDGIHRESPVFVDQEGDTFIFYDDRFFDCELFTDGIKHRFVYNTIPVAST